METERVGHQPQEQQNVSLEEFIRQQFRAFCGNDANFMLLSLSPDRLTTDQKDGLRETAYHQDYPSYDGETRGYSARDFFRQAVYQYFLGKKPAAYRKAWESLEAISYSDKKKDKNADGRVLSDQEKSRIAERQALKEQARFLMSLLFQQHEKALELSSRELVHTAKVSLSAIATTSQDKQTRAVQAFFYAVGRLPSWEKDVFRTYAAVYQIQQRDNETQEQVYLSHLYQDGNPGKDLANLQFLENRTVEAADGTRKAVVGVDAYVRYKVYQGLWVQGLIHSDKYVAALEALQRRLANNDDRIPCEMVVSGVEMSREKLIDKINSQRLAANLKLKTEQQVTDFYTQNTQSSEKSNIQDKKLTQRKETVLDESPLKDYWRSLKNYVFDPKDEGVFWTIVSPLVYLGALIVFPFYAPIAKGIQLYNASKKKDVPHVSEQSQDQQQGADFLFDLKSRDQEVTLAFEEEPVRDRAATSNSNIAVQASAASQQRVVGQKNTLTKVQEKLEEMRQELIDKKTYRKNSRYVSMRNDAIDTAHPGLRAEQNARPQFGLSVRGAKATVSITVVPQPSARPEK